MDESTPASQPKIVTPTPQNDLVQRPKTGFKKPLVLGLLFLGTIILLFTASFAAVLLNQQKQVTLPTPTPTPETQITPTPTSVVVPDRGHRYVAYIENTPTQNIWLVDTQGTNRQPVTTNDDQNTTFRDIKWHEFDVLQFTECSSSGCSIQTYSVYANSTEELFNSSSISSGVIITAFATSQDNKQLAYMYNLADGRTFIHLKNQNQTTTLKELPAVLGRGGIRSDEVKLTFSPDGNYLLAVNTTIQPNTDQKSGTLWVFDTNNGSQLFELGTQNRFASMASWLDNRTILYVLGDGLFQKDIHTQGETTLAEFTNRYNPQLSLDNTQLVLWTFPVAQRTQIETFNLANKTFTSRTNNFFQPQWLTTTEVVALATEINTSELEVSDFLVTGKLSKVNISNNTTLELVPDNVSLFAVEPLRY